MATGTNTDRGADAAAFFENQALGAVGGTGEVEYVVIWTRRGTAEAKRLTCTPRARAAFIERLGLGRNDQWAAGFQQASRVIMVGTVEGMRLFTQRNPFPNALCYEPAR